MSLNKSQRAASWNVKFLNYTLPFGGVYQCAGMLSVADIAHELNVCFVSDPPDNAAPWAPALILTSPGPQNLIILDQHSDDLFPTPPTDSIHTYEYVFHRDCARPGDQHDIQDACISRRRGMVSRRHDGRYIDIGSKSTYAIVAEFPTRSSSQTRTSSLKRESTHSSQSSSPSRIVATIPEELSFISAAERRDMNKTMSQYANNVLLSRQSCVITGEGNYRNLPGPGLEAAHIIPQSQWNVFPVYGDLPDSSDFEQLRLAWRGTWDAQRNGIMLLSTLYRCFDARLIAFHPKTHLIRVFIDYDAIKQYHGKKASLPKLIPEEVLQHHWDMCCLENTVGSALPPPKSLANIPESPRPKARKLDHSDLTKQGSSLQAIDSQATDSQATDTQAADTQATDTQAYSTFMYNGAHQPSPPLSERASEEYKACPVREETLNDPVTIEQVTEEDAMLEKDHAEYVRGRPRKRKQPGCTATEESAEGRDDAHGVKKPRLGLSPGTPFTGL